MTREEKVEFVKQHVAIYAELLEEEDLNALHDLLTKRTEEERP